MKRRMKRGGYHRASAERPDDGLVALGAEEAKKSAREAVRWYRRVVAGETQLADLTVTTVKRHFGALLRARSYGANGRAL